MTPDQWAKDQLKPLSLFEIAKWRADGLKVAGAGNGAGFLTAGAALTLFRDHPRALLEVKFSGFCFFIGVMAFAYGMLKLYGAMHAQDEVAQATLHNDVKAINENSAISTNSMMVANTCAVSSTVLFFLGCIVGLIAFLSF